MGLKGVIGFESDHNGGKGTQIKLLKNYCEKNGIDVLVSRGAIYREGLGNDLGDPYSEFWIQRMKDYPKVDNMDINQRFIFEKENAIRLRRELNIGLRFLKEKIQKDILLILDRTELSGYFWLKKIYPNLSFQEYVNFSTPHNTVIGIIKPDLIFALEANKEELLKRNEKRGEKNSSRNLERKNNIINHHELFEEIIRTSDNDFNVFSLNGLQEENVIHDSIVKKIENEILLE